jgi:hypothetical protein
MRISYIEVKPIKSSNTMYMFKYVNNYENVSYVRRISNHENTICLGILVSVHENSVPCIRLRNRKLIPSQRVRESNYNIGIS